MSKNGNSESFDQIVTSQVQALKQKMVDEASFPFTLKNIEGKIVSLNDMNEKVVILDFGQPGADHTSKQY